MSSEYFQVLAFFCIVCSAPAYEDSQHWFLAVVVVSLLGAGAEDAEERRAECVMWSHLENKTMPLQDQGHATCRTNDECSGFTCDGHFKVHNKYILKYQI